MSAVEGETNKKEAGLMEVWSGAPGVRTVSRPVMALHVLQQAFRSFVLSPITFTACLVTVIVAMFVLGAFLLLIHNIGGALQRGGEEMSCRFYLHDGAEPDAVKKLYAGLSAEPGIKQVKVVSKAQALEEFRRELGEQAGLLDGLDAENPLPASFEAALRSEAQSLLPVIAERYKNHPAVEYVQYDKELLMKLGEVARFFRRGALLSALFMLVVTGVIIANTVRLTLASRNDEIVIMRLVGASSSFVKAPALIEGALHGMLGALISLGLLFLAWRGLLHLLPGAAVWESLSLSVGFLPASWSLLVVLSGAFVGLAGSYIAVRRLAET